MLNKNQTILHLLTTSLPTIAGYTIRSQNILQEQIKYLDILALVEAKKRSNKIYIKNGVPYYKYPKLPGNYIFSKLNFLRLFKISKIYNILTKFYLIYYLKTFVETQKVGLIHAHSPAKNAIFGYFIAKIKNIPFIYEVRYFPEYGAIIRENNNLKSLRYKLTYKTETFLMRKADAVITLGQSMTKEIIKRGIPEKNIYLVPNGVDGKKFEPLEENINLKKKYNLNNKKIIGFIGSVRNYEGIEILLKSFSLLKEDLKLLIIGPTRPYDYLITLKELSRKLGIIDEVIFIGKIPYEKINEYYSIIDIFVLPRLNTKETRLVTPLKPLEVMAMSKLLIVSDLPALRELVKPEVSGVLFEPENPKDLAYKIEEYLNNEQKRKRLQKSAREYVINNYRWSEVVKKYLSIYSELLS